MGPLRRLSYVIAGGTPDDEPPHAHRHHHLHHHHHEKDYTVAPTGGNVPLKIPTEEETSRRHRHCRRRATTEEKVQRPLRIIDPGFEPRKSSQFKRSSVNSDASSTSSSSSLEGVKIEGGQRLNHGETPPLTPEIKTTPPSPSPIEQARRTDSQPAKLPPYPVTPPRQDSTGYVAYTPTSNMATRHGEPQKRYSDSSVPSRFAPHAGAVEIGSSESIVQKTRRVDSTNVSPRSSGSRPSDQISTTRHLGLNKSRGSTKENQYDFLKTFDTVFVIDDSASMAGEYWTQLGQALETITTIATKYDSDGIDIHFLNSSQYDRTHITSSKSVRELFDRVQPSGITPTGACLDRILREYLGRYADAKDAYSPSTSSPGPHPTMYASLPKPLNILVLTDGEPTDDPESVIVAAARKLDKLNAPLHQVGIQFVQIGNEKGAREALEELDDALEEIYGVRDMVDFTPFTDGERVVTREVILKALLGAVNRRYDRWKNEF